MKLTITVKAANHITPGFEVQRDSVAIGRAGWGTAVPVDPGPHRIEARAPGKKPWSTAVNLDASQGSILVSIPALEDAPAETKAERAAPSLPGDRKSSSSGAAQRVAAAAVGGIGVAAVGVGTLFGILASSKKHESNLYCDQNLCDQRGVDLREEALTNATVSTVSIVGGAVALIGGMVLYFTAPSSGGPLRTGVLAAPYVGPGAIGATFSGAF